jgi:hypothetical protein
MRTVWTVRVQAETVGTRGTRPRRGEDWHYSTWRTDSCPGSRRSRNQLEEYFSGYRKDSKTRQADPKRGREELIEQAGLEWFCPGCFHCTSLVSRPPMPPFANRVKQHLLKGARAAVPALWHLEMNNGLVVAQRRSILTAVDVDQAVIDLEPFVARAVDRKQCRFRSPVFGNSASLSAIGL